LRSGGGGLQGWAWRVDQKSRRGANRAGQQHEKCKRGYKYPESAHYLHRVDPFLPGSSIPIVRKTAKRGTSVDRPPLLGKTVCLGRARSSRLSLEMRGTTLVAAEAIQLSGSAPGRSKDGDRRGQTGGVSLTHRMGACTLADGRLSVTHDRPYVQASLPETPHDPA
jgi:hypothetical protein